jgi:hypothetical protein
MKDFIYERIFASKNIVKIKLKKNEISFNYSQTIHTIYADYVHVSEKEISSISL